MRLLATFGLYLAVGLHASLAASIPTSDSELADINDFTCQGRSSGAYANYGSSCQQYYVCSSVGMRSEHSCPPGDLFSDSTNACMPEEEVQCSYKPHSSLPSKRQVKFYFDPTIKRQVKFTKSAAGKRQVKFFVSPESQRQRRGDEHSDVAVSHEVRPPRSRFSRSIFDTDFESLCLYQEDGYYADTTRGCNYFYRCLAGIQRDFRCPGSLVFNENKIMCDIPSEYECPYQGEYERSAEKRQPPRKERRDKRQVKFFIDEALAGDLARRADDARRSFIETEAATADVERTQSALRQLLNRINKALWS